MSMEGTMRSTSAPVRLPDWKKLFVTDEPSWVSGNAARGAAAPVGWVLLIPISMFLMVLATLAAVGASPMP